jgi:TPR repeat protein
MFDPQSFAACLVQRQRVAMASRGATQSTANPDRVSLYRLYGQIGNDEAEGGHYLRAGQIDQALRAYSRADQEGEILASMGPTIDAVGNLRVNGVPAGAAFDNVAEARFSIGEIFETQRGGAALAAHWYQKAVDTPGKGFGHDEAAIHLAFLYLHGTGVPRDPPRARQLLASVGEGYGEKYAAMFDHNMLPARADELNGQRVNEALEKISEQQVAAIVAALAAVSSSQRERPIEHKSIFSPDPMTCALAFASGSGLLTGLAC